MALPQRITTIEQNGSPLPAAAVLYRGEVMHARLQPFAHRFVYRVFTLLLDVDRLKDADRQSRFFSVNRANVVSFHEADHLENADGTIRAHVNGLLSQAGLEQPAARILLLTFPRVFGYVFNPISVYFAYDDDAKLCALIYAVRNTFGQKHTYVARLEQGELTAAGIRQERAKLFHVSPFIDMDARYHFRVMPPGKIMRLRIHETAKGQPLLSATLTGQASPLDDRSMLSALLNIPFLTWKVIAGIHWEALKLWLKGAKFHRSPPSPKPVSFGDKENALEQ